jgi:ribose 5-phosphate isomerase A
VNLVVLQYWDIAYGDGCSFIVVADYRKNAESLGTNVSISIFYRPSLCPHSFVHPFIQYPPGVPIEVVPFAYVKILNTLRKTFGSPKAALRMAVKKGACGSGSFLGVLSISSIHSVLAGPVVTDNGNFVIDAPFEPGQLQDPATVRIRFYIWYSSS